MLVIRAKYTHEYIYIYTVMVQSRVIGRNVVFLIPNTASIQLVYRTFYNLSQCLQDKLIPKYMYIHIYLLKNESYIF